MHAKILFLIVCCSFALCASSLYESSSPDSYQHATLAGGCFWCMEAIFERIPGVIDAESGYAGGHLFNPTYLDVKSGKSGYAEVIKITFDPNKIPYADILNAFFYAHDPTTLNRQGIDVGHQYRSAIYYHNEQQKQIAEQILEAWRAKRVYEDPIVTELNPLNNYYPAEDYHQDYFNSFKENQFCTVDTADIAHKIEKFFIKFDHFSNKTTNLEHTNYTEHVEQNSEVVVTKPDSSNIKVVRSTNPFHPWHNITYGAEAPEVVQALIEIQKGSTVKYEVDKQSGYLALDRVVHPDFPYPAYYGFIPQTLYGDGDGLDVLILSSVSLRPLTLVPVRVIGLISMLDAGEMDDKILTVVHRDRTFSHVQDVSDLEHGVVEELTSYFENYKKPDNGKVIIKGVGGKEVGYKAIEEGIQLYKDIYVLSN